MKFNTIDFVLFQEIIFKQIYNINSNHKMKIELVKAIELL